jgi:hypothetical protein
MRPPPPDIVLLATEWRPRALIRAQLIEEGFEVVATNAWPVMRRHLRPGMKPLLALIDLKGLPSPVNILNDLRVLMKPDHVLALSALGTIPESDIKRLGFRAVSRPIVIEDVVGVAREAIRTASSAMNHG